MDLSKLAPGSHVHVLGICGTGVGAVALLLKELGFFVSGTDKAFYPPMKEVVESAADKLYKGYSPANLEQLPDYVIVGNAIREDNPEMVRVRELGLNYCSMPDALGALLIGDCETSVVVAGTHGKTTTTAAIAHYLTAAKRDPGFFVGGVPKTLDTQIRKGAGEVVVLEGDEYDSAYFAKWAKFQSYRPDIFVVTSLEFDHADIYQSLDEIEEQFDLAISKMKPDGKLLICSDYPRLDAWKEKYELEVITFGDKEGSDYQITSREYHDGMQVVEGKNFSFSTKLGGAYNAKNMLATYIVGKLVGVDQVENLTTFTGVKRRQEVLVETEQLVLIEDFAHHPTAVKEAIAGLKERYPERKVISVFEPRSNTSRRSIFQDEYNEALSLADRSYIKKPLPLGYSKFGEDEESLDVNLLPGTVFEEKEEVLSLVKEFLGNSKAVVVLMSNGDFDGLPGYFSEMLQQ